MSRIFCFIGKERTEFESIFEVACVNFSRTPIGLQVLGFGKWQSDRERRALAGATADVDAAAEFQHEVLDDRKSQTGPTDVARAGSIDTIEALEDPRLMLFRDAWPVVLDFNYP